MRLPALWKPGARAGGVALERPSTSGQQCSLKCHHASGKIVTGIPRQHQGPIPAQTRRMINYSINATPCLVVSSLACLARQARSVLLDYTQRSRRSCVLSCAGIVLHTYTLDPPQNTMRALHLAPCVAHTTPGLVTPSHARASLRPAPLPFTWRRSGRPVDVPSGERGRRQRDRGAGVSTAEAVPFAPTVRLLVCPLARYAVTPGRGTGHGVGPCRPEETRERPRPQPPLTGLPCCSMGILRLSAPHGRVGQTNSGPRHANAVMQD